MNITVGSAARLPQRLVNDLACYRYRVFVERLGWPLSVDNGHEVDQFDHDDTVYVVARSDEGRVIGCARLLPTIGPYLLGDVFPQLLSGMPAPRLADVWELSRFAAIDLDAETTDSFSGQFSSPTAIGLLRAALNSAAEWGVRELITVSPLGVERLLRKAGFNASRIAKPCLVDGRPLFACRIHVHHDTGMVQ